MVGSLVLALLGWAALYAAMDRPRLALYPPFSNRFSRAVLRLAGALLLVLSLICSMQDEGSTVGFVAWWVWLAVTAFGFTVWRGMRRV